MLRILEGLAWAQDYDEYLYADTFFGVLMLVSMPAPNHPIFLVGRLEHDPDVQLDHVQNVLNEPLIESMNTKEETGKLWPGDSLLYKP
jgi:hypothetical protein